MSVVLGGLGSGRTGSGSIGSGSLEQTCVPRGGEALPVETMLVERGGVL
jgi:hypothetical protein